MKFDWLKDIWTTKTSPKLKVLLWSVTQRALPIGESLQKRGILTDVSCLHCKGIETTMHIFFNCPFGKQVWCQIPFFNPVHLTEDLDFKTALMKLRSSICLPPTGLKNPIISWVCWFLWLARNKLIFEQLHQSAAEVATRSLTAAREWEQAQPLSRKSKQGPPSATSQDRRANTLSITSTPIFCKTDAAWNSSTRKAGIACVLHRPDSPSPESFSLQIDNVTSPLMAEALALLQGIEKAIKSEITSITFLSDCSTLIRAINCKASMKEIYGVFTDIASLSSTFACISFKHISRSQNEDADSLVKWALKADSSSVSSFVSPILGR